MEGFDDIPEAHEAIVVDKPRAIETRQASESRLRGMTDKLLREAEQTILDASYYRHIDPEQIDVVPEEWVRELGPERAEIRRRTAAYALLPSAKAPIGLRMQKDVMIGILKVRAAEKVAPRVFNAVLIQMPSASAPMAEIVTERVK